MNAELLLFASRMAGAATHEDVFGDLRGPDELKKIFRQTAKIAHPDRYRTAEDRSLAELTFTRLTAGWMGWWSAISTGWRRSRIGRCAMRIDIREKTPR
ncbi:MAG TPA: hypothetical protein VMT46_12055 [Anaerolineaceae bacterium]|nr:hypothetical protein [Anaerolineaceae bacterium]